MQASEKRLAEIAARQDDVVTRAQLIRAGLGRGAIDARTAAGGLRRLHRGVYFLGYAPPGPLAVVPAAVLACGEGAVASHWSAAGIWGLLPFESEPDVLVAGGNPGEKPGVRVHRTAHLDRADIRIRDDLPLTSPSRTVCDLAASAPLRVTERAVPEAVVRRLSTESQLLAAAARIGNRPGSAAMCVLLGAEQGPGFTRSQAERVLLKLIAAAGLPAPEKNVQIGSYRVDFVWRAQRIAVEVDGYQFHGHRAAFERDRRRDRSLRAAGFTVIRITWRALQDEPLRVVADLARSLTRAA